MENVDCEVLLLEAETKDQTFTFCANQTLKKFLSFKKSVFYAYRDSLPAFSLNLFPSQYLPISLSLPPPLFPTPLTFHPYIFLSFFLSFQLLYFPPSFLLSSPSFLSFPRPSLQHDLDSRGERNTLHLDSAGLLAHTETAVALKASPLIPCCLPRRGSHILAGPQLHLNSESRFSLARDTRLDRGRLETTPTRARDTRQRGRVECE